MKGAPTQKLIREMDFVTSFTYMQADAAAINKQSGFVDQESMIDQLEAHLTSTRGELLPLVEMFKHARVGLKLALATGELSEALEAVRKNIGAGEHIPDFSAEEAEIADAVIRLMNYATDRKLRLAEAIAAKNEFNRNRADHKKENRATEHGKRF